MEGIYLIGKENAEDSGILQELLKNAAIGNLDYVYANYA